MAVTPEVLGSKMYRIILRWRENIRDTDYRKPEVDRRDTMAENEKRSLKWDLSVRQESLFAFFVNTSDIAAELQENIAVLAFFINGVGTS